VPVPGRAAPGPAARRGAAPPGAASCDAAARRGAAPPGAASRDAAASGPGRAVWGGALARPRFVVPGQNNRLEEESEDHDLPAGAGDPPETYPHRGAATATGKLPPTGRRILST
jgi:hypothetical protein